MDLSRLPRAIKTSRHRQESRPAFAQSRPTASNLDTIAHCSLYLSALAVTSSLAKQRPESAGQPREQQILHDKGSRPMVDCLSHCCENRERATLLRPLSEPSSSSKPPAARPSLSLPAHPAVTILGLPCACGASDYRYAFVDFPSPTALRSTLVADPRRRASVEP